MLGIGAEAPAFSVQDHHGETLRLADLRGQKVLLWFYPKADPVVSQNSIAFLHQRFPDLSRPRATLPIAQSSLLWDAWH